MAHFVLIHGSAHSAWHWHLLIPALQALGHDVRAIDLPGHGADLTPPGEVTLASYAEAIIAALPAEPAILVGHSMAGYPITEAAARAPERIARLVYLCAYLPTPGLSIAQMRRQSPVNTLRGAITVAADQQSFTFDPDRARELFYHDVPAPLAAEAIAHQCTQPMAPQVTPVSAFAPPALPRSYILCRDDRTIPPAHQAIMSAGVAPADIHPIDTSHSPFLADPAGLAALLSRLAA